ncbi:MAG: mechanosensitive ion channel family protein [Candidatus Thorarchaeota archaeon]
MADYSDSLEELIEPLKDYELWSNSGVDYLLSATIFVLCFMLLYVIKFILLSRTKSWVKKREIERGRALIDAIDSLMSMVLIFIVSFFLATRNLELSDTANEALLLIVLVAFCYYVLKFAFKLVDALIAFQVARRAEDRHILELLRTLMRATIIVVVLMWALSNLGMNINALIAGFGIFGLAIAFASQNVMADIFASITIYLDRPFEVGDSIKIGSDSGTIEKIGIRSTKIRSLDGPLLIISNRELTTTRIFNFKRMTKRRVVFTIGVSVNTPASKLKKIPDMVKAIIEAQEETEFNRVHFVTIGAFDFQYEIVYHVTTPDFLMHRNLQHAINLAILEKFEEEGIEIPYPTQAVIVKQ